MSRMSASVLGGAALLLATVATQADDSCKVEDWRWYVPHGDTLAIEGFAFEAYVDKVDKPNDIAIRYTIDPEG